MSLLHQVLQDIDKRDAVPSALPHALQMSHESAALAASGTAYSASERAHSGAFTLKELSIKSIQPLLWSALMFVPAVFYFLHHDASQPEAASTVNTVSPVTSFVAEKQPGKPLVLRDNNNAAEQAEALSVQAPVPFAPEAAADPIIAETVAAEPVAAEPVAVQRVADRSRSSTAEKTQSSIRALETQKIKPEVDAAATKNSSAFNTTNTVSESRSSVVRSGQQAQQYYRQATEYMAVKQFSQALSAVDQALAIEIREDYLAIKLRIYLEQKAQDKFLQLYAQNTSVLHPYWLAVAAPGLHLFGRLEDAARVYQQLILLQPEVVNWPLALAQALQSAGRTQQARSVLEGLYQQNRLTPAQQRWVEQKLRRSGPVNTN
ncbi:tetratricopeptide repeat protein [Thalassolituus pacificus]|uniref:Tetratricopeptide repeat protein n=1 Tax=Thalassolituus pacificus TaxID=2975440 RepID=A0A9X2WI25_9GAMM|nr:hypothetical protein [Thalassolituus pacificus]MCT7360460.1 hypothetical protein [Thalassolituus pacificus]